MNAACSRILNEMAVFADLGTDGAPGGRTREGYVVRLFRNGDELYLVFPEDGAGQVIERCRGSKPRTHASCLALLASERFGDLRSWAATQKMLLREALMAFLANDALPGYRRFAHSQLFDYFLIATVIESVGRGEIPKFVRRNI